MSSSKSDHSYIFAVRLTCNSMVSRTEELPFGCYVIGANKHCLPSSQIVDKSLFLVTLLFRYVVVECILSNLLTNHTLPYTLLYIFHSKHSNIRFLFYHSIRK